MPRESRAAFVDKLNHILVQGVEQEEIFSDKDYKDYYIKCLNKGLIITDVKLIAYCIMPTHAHLILKSKDALSLSQFMSKLSISYARFYNAVKIREGKVFDKRYISQPIDSAELLINCINFIHTNPVECNLVENAADYQYSSMREYKTENGIVNFAEINNYIGKFSAAEIKKYSISSDTVWKEDVKSVAENIDAVLKELLLKYNITSRAMLWNQEVLRNLSLELMNRCHLSLRKIAEKLQIGRETLRKIIKESSDNI